MIRYFKEYHDNVRTPVRRIELYTTSDINHEFDIAVNSIIDNKTNLNDSEAIDSLINLSKDLDENYKDLPADTYDDLSEVVNSGLYYELGNILKNVHRVNCGDYDLVKEVDDNYD